MITTDSPYRTVKTGTVEVSYSITEYDMEDDSKVYDWVADSGHESDDLFDTLEDAERDAIYALGG